MRVLSKAASNTIFWVFGMTQPGIELRSPEPIDKHSTHLANGPVIQTIFFIQPDNHMQGVTQGQFLSKIFIQFSSPWTDCYTMIKEPSLPNYLPINGGRIEYKCYVKSKQHHPRFELWSPCLFPVVITITSQAYIAIRFGALFMRWICVCIYTPIHTHVYLYPCKH